MGCSAVLKARCALVVLIRAFAVTYNVVVTCSRVSTDKDVARSCRKVVLKARPGHGGSTVDTGWLNDAQAAWHTCEEVV